MKYKIEKSDLFIDNKLYPEGSVLELSKEQIKGIESFLTSINESSNSSLVEGSQKKLNDKGNKK